MSDELERKGVKFKLEVILDKERLIQEEDGYLLSQERIESEQFELRCSISKREKLIPLCFSVDGKKNITLMKLRSEDEHFSVFSKKISITKTNSNILITRYPENNLRILFPEEKGRFEIWEVAIVSQDGLFFLTSQMTYEAECFRGKDGKVICPRFEWETEWPQLMEIVKPIFEGVELQPISEYLPPSPPKAEGFPKNHGKVVWWNLAQGWGEIVLDERGTTAKVHWKGIQPNPKGRLRYLLPGQIISFRKLDQARGRTGFLLEAKEVNPLEREEKNANC